MKNCVVIPGYNNYKEKLPFGLKSWEYYCNKYNLELTVLDSESSFNRNQAIWQCWFDIEKIFTKHDRMLLVDLDTIVRWDTPNLFEIFSSHFNCINHCPHFGESPGEYHYEEWKNFIDFIPNNSFYFNTGVLLFNKSHYKTIKKYLLPYYEYYMDQELVGNNPPPNKQRLSAYEQTPINLVVQKHLTSEIRFKPLLFNDLVMTKYNDYKFIDESYIWHFTGNNMGNDRAQVMNQTWNQVKQYYK